ncbi:DDE-type integrase/transposase/recombinase [Alcanivorax sp. 1008]|uniref:DDE-type integrase/transposase/recombinase n=1 Tax=Alcanivorax sp. 1008 TaxID=2816853 RepID=UPI001D1F2309|nr:DDE-type integrase/transposase/recombinase [Alcanivorax sp. 1008]MCC1498008.1 DDE-type integrase/transposase/recombinase [Alcanivorax sp. 1008]
MLGDKELNEYLERLNIGHEASAYIRHVRNSEPSRMVGARAKRNVVSFVASRKMNRTISTESRMPERAFVALCEYEKDILEYWDQPEAENISIVDKNGKRRRVWYTPDYLVLSRESVFLVEVKDINECLKLVENNANWHGKDGVYEYTPAKEKFLNMGLVHSVFCYKPCMKYRIANIEAMLKTRFLPALSEDILMKVKYALEKTAWMSLQQLKEKVNLDSYSELIQMLDQGKIFSNIDRALISSPRGFLVSLSHQCLDLAYSEMSKDQIYDGSDVLDHDVEIIPSEKSAMSALEKIRRIDAGESSRSVRRWKAAIEQGKSEGKSRFQALLPAYHQSGNRTQKIPKVVNEYLLKHLKEVFSSANGISVHRGYHNYKDLAKLAHPEHPPVSRATFRTRISELPKPYLGRKRGGTRLENAMQAAAPIEFRGLKKLYGWECAAIDHYLADVYLKIFTGSDYVYVARPWITAMIDLASGKDIAFSLSLLSPSRISVARVIRACVRKYKKLPAEIIVDRGSEFKSVFFASLLAHLGITLSLRPKSHPRYGSEVERLFKGYKEMFLCTLPGNVANPLEVRSVDRDFSPDKHAVLTPYDFYCELSQFVDWRNNKPVSPDSMSPAAIFEKSQKAYPFIGREVDLDHEFLVASSIEAKRYTVNVSQGIHIGEMMYWNDRLASLPDVRRKVDVRLDPENPYLVYALIDGQWSPCGSSRLPGFASLDPVEQRVRNLEVVDALNSRREIREHADEALAAILRQANEQRTSINGDSISDAGKEGPDLRPRRLPRSPESELPPLSGEIWGARNER